MSNITHRGIAYIPAANDPILIPARAAYTEIALGMKPNYDRYRQAHHAGNYEITRLALLEHIREHGSLPTWKATEPPPMWLAKALHQVIHDLKMVFHA